MTTVLQFSGSSASGRTVLQIAQDVAVKLGIDSPAELFGSSEKTAIKLRRVIIEASDKLVEAHDWRRLYTLETHTGAGGLTSYELPSDFLRMPKDAKIWSSKWDAPLIPVDPEDWLQLTTRGFASTLSCWTIYGGNVVYYPALSIGETAQFWYISHAVINGEDSSQFTADTDTFLLDDRLLELMVIVVWRAQERLDYQEDLVAVNDALSRAICRDGGARLIRQRSRGHMGGETAFPFSVTT